MVMIAQVDVMCVVLNAGLSLYVAEKVDTIAEGIELATTLIDNGEALKNTIK